MNKHFLFTHAGFLTLQLKYVRLEMSTHIIAKEFNTYPNMVKRALIKHGIKLRTKAEAQKTALKTGTAKHPKRRNDDKEKST